VTVPIVVTLVKGSPKKQNVSSGFVTLFKVDASRQRAA
jgi:hypothetical protein